jgi:CubicO group peptidase (beta-lactamase class C family)
MAAGLSMTSSDVARIGYLLLRNGRWNGTQLISAAWIEQMRERESQKLGQWLTYPADYGRTLWLLPPVSNADVLASSGVYGQWIFVVPGKDLVVVATCNARNVGDFALPIQLLYDTIIPAAH